MSISAYTEPGWGGRGLRKSGVEGVDAGGESVNRVRQEGAVCDGCTWNVKGNKRLLSSGGGGRWGWWGGGGVSVAIQRH